MEGIFKQEKFHFVLAFIIRLAFTLFGQIHDSQVSQIDPASNTTNVVPKYTDIDYQVFSDAAIYVNQGESPYRRETYRYTPILAYLLQPNIVIHESFGKLLFVLFDLVCGYLVLKINQMQESGRCISSLTVWFYNPITVAIASRGNAESVMACLVLTFIYFLKRDANIRAGIFYALAIHFKIYPITYALVILFHYIDLGQLKFNSVFLNYRLFKFGMASLTTLSLLTLVFYLKYGHEFLFETYLYHLTRQDTRHNFSPYFYMLYLSGADAADSLVLKALNFMPQLILVVTFSVYFYRNLEFAFFSITFMFVTFNKVCTSQYFVWYLSIIPILVPRLRIRPTAAFGYFLLWVFGQAVWLYFAYELEFNGENTFPQIWLASLLFASINCYVYKFAFLDRYEFVLTKEKIN